MNRRNVLKGGVLAWVLGLCGRAPATETLDELKSMTWDYWNPSHPVDYRDPPHKQIRNYLFDLVFARGGETEGVSGLPFYQSFMPVVRCNVAERWIECLYLSDGGIVKDSEGEMFVQRFENVQDMILDVLDIKGNIITTLRSDG